MFDAFSEARMHAVQMREVYDAYIFAGFSPDEAFTLTTILVRNLSQQPR